MPSSTDAGKERPQDKLHSIRFPRMRFSPGSIGWWVAAYIAVTLVCTAGWLFLGQRLAEQTGLRRQVWLANDFQGVPFIRTYLKIEIGAKLIYSYCDGEVDRRAMGTDSGALS